ncbi:Aspartic proteinase nepenthesin-2 [Hordeum vulgare]|nr:Aspartic proteinase nepenthesin-2 [Hordeum vulgare]
MPISLCTRHIDGFWSWVHEKNGVFTVKSSYRMELEECKPKKPSSDLVPAQRHTPLRWIPPPSGFVKIRVDAVVARNRNEGSFSVVCRDSSGLYLGSSAIRISGVTDPPTLEALPCCEALALASDLVESHVITASDCQAMVLDIKKQIGGMYASIVKEIVHTARSFNDCTFIFEGRASNLEAHSLAKHAFGLDFGHHVLLLNPPDLQCIIVNIIEQ